MASVIPILAAQGGLDFASLFADPQCGYRWRSFVVPDVANRQIAGRGTFEDQISLPAGSFLVSISSSSSQTAGFRFSIVDAGTRERIASDTVMSGVLSGSPRKFAARGGPFFLPAPWTVSDAGLVLVQISNLAVAANVIDLHLQFAEPL